MHIFKNYLKPICISIICIIITFILAIIFNNNENSDIVNRFIGVLSSRTSSYITNMHIVAAMGFAFVAGVAAAFNPCGFVMLPAYIGLYLQINRNQKISKKLLNALIISLSMTMGFTILFALFAFIVGLGAKAILYSILPWMGILIGILLVILGSWLLSGNSFYTNILHNIGQKANIKNEDNIKTYFMFGFSYGIVSLSCTFPIFLAVIGNTLSSETLINKITQFIFYSAGMGLVVIIITFSMTIIKIDLNKKLQILSIYINKISTWLIIVAGCYIIYYWLTYGELMLKMKSP